MSLSFIENLKKKKKKPLFHGKYNDFQSSRKHRIKQNKRLIQVEEVTAKARIYIIISKSNLRVNKIP